MCRNQVYLQICFDFHLSPIQWDLARRHSTNSMWLAAGGQPTPSPTSARTSFSKDRPISRRPKKAGVVETFGASSQDFYFHPLFSNILLRPLSLSVDTSSLFLLLLDHRFVSGLKRKKCYDEKSVKNKPGQNCSQLSFPSNYVGQGKTDVNTWKTQLHVACRNSA